VRLAKKKYQLTNDRVWEEGKELVQCRQVVRKHKKWNSWSHSVRGCEGKIGVTGNLFPMQAVRAEKNKEELSSSGEKR